MSRIIRIPLTLTDKPISSDGPVRVLMGIPGPRGATGSPGDFGTAIFPGHGTYLPNTVINTLNAIIDRKTEDDDFPDFSLLIENRLV